MMKLGGSVSDEIPKMQKKRWGKHLRFPTVIGANACRTFWLRRWAILSTAASAKNSVTAPPIVFRGGVAAPLCLPILEKNGLVQPRHEWGFRIVSSATGWKEREQCNTGQQKNCKKKLSPKFTWVVNNCSHKFSQSGFCCKTPGRLLNVGHLKELSKKIGTKHQNPCRVACVWFG